MENRKPNALGCIHNFRMVRFCLIRLVPVVMAALFLPWQAACALDSTAVADPLAAALMAREYPIRPLAVRRFIMPSGRSLSYDEPRVLHSLDRYPIPGLASRVPELRVKVLQTVPVTEALFPANSVVTLGWLPVDELYYEEAAPSQAQIPIRYEIILERHDNWGQRIYIREHPTTRHYTHLFTPLGPGRYHWHVRAVYDKAMHGINSDTRTFTVLP